MSLMGYGKMAGIGATVGTGIAVGGAALGIGTGLKGAKAFGTEAVSRVGATLGTYGVGNAETGEQTRAQKVASAVGTKMYTSAQNSRKKSADPNRHGVSDAFMNAGTNSINNTVRKVMPRSSYNASYYRRKKNMI